MPALLDPSLRDRARFLSSRHALPNMPPMLRGGQPLLGHMRPFNREPIDLLHEGVRRHGEAFTLNLLGTPAAVLTGPEAHEAYFTASDDQLSQREAYRLMTPIFGRGIAYDAEPHVMKEQLGFLHPALKKRRMETYAELMNEEAERYVESWGDEGVVDIFDVTTELTIYISSRCLLGEEFRSRMSSDVGEIYRDMEGGLTPIAFLFPYLPIPAFRRRDRARKQLVERLTQVIRQRRASGVRGEDALQTLMECKYSDGRPLTEHEITSLLLVMVFAGHHTSSVVSAWTGILLLMHPQYLPEVIDEQKSVFGQNQPVSYDTLKNLAALERAIKEAERMYPPLVILMRKVLHDFQYKSWTLPAGSLGIVSPAVSHRLPDVFRDPNRYDPDRFGPDRQEDRTNHFNIITFGGGAHRCIGEHFAHMQIKALWSVLLRNFDLELASPIYQPSYDFLVVGPRHPALVRFRRKKRVLVSVPRQVSARAS